MRYEALVDRALGPYRFSGLCRYDTRFTPADLLDRALIAHHNVITADGARPTDGASRRADLLRELTPTHGSGALDSTPPVLSDTDCVAVAPMRTPEAETLALVNTSPRHGWRRSGGALAGRRGACGGV
jgi:hypothetical protein